MAVVLRLSRAGTHKAPFYHVVATDSRKPRDGKYIEDVGTYDPTRKPELIQFKTERVLSGSPMHAAAALAGQLPARAAASFSWRTRQYVADRHT